MRQIGCLFFVLTFLAGITVTGGSATYGLINVVVFLTLALGFTRWLEPRFGAQGIVYGMGGAFFASFLWPYLLIPFMGKPDCVGDDCLAGIFVTAQPAEQEQAQP